MDIELPQRQSTADDPRTASLALHLLPCGIDYDGPAAVSTYFVVERRSTEAADDTSTDDASVVNASATAHYNATFRGRELRGVAMPVPAGYEGLVYTEAVVRSADNNSAGDDDENDDNDAETMRQWRVRSTFDHVHLWQHDFLPHPRDHPYLRVGAYIEACELVAGDADM